MKAFEALVEASEQVTHEHEAAQKLSGEVHDEVFPPLYAAHLILDGREYVLTLMPTDLGKRGAVPAGEEGA